MFAGSHRLETTALAYLQDTLNKFYPYNLDRVLEKCYKDTSLGDRRPSEYLEELKNKLKDENGNPNTNLINFFFQRILPTNIKNILASNKNLNMEERGTLADQIYNNEQNTINNINKSEKKLENDKETIDFLLNKIEHLNKEIKLLKEIKQTSPEIKKKNYIQRNQKQLTYDRRNNPSNQNSYCFYHSKFGDNAFRCTSPCNYNKNKVN